MLKVDWARSLVCKGCAKTPTTKKAIRWSCGNIVYRELILHQNRLPLLSSLLENLERLAYL